MLRIFLTGIVGLVVGVVLAIAVTGPLLGRTLQAAASVNIDGWISDWSIGAENANPYVRARVAKDGLLAMTKDQAVYFIKATDDEGRPLTSACDYALRGEGQDGYWWSITLYNDEAFLPLNDGSALSIDATQLGRGPWQATVSQTRPGDGSAWISSVGTDGFDLALRVYRPSERLLENPETVLNPPTIKRIACEGGPA